MPSGVVRWIPVTVGVVVVLVGTSCDSQSERAETAEHTKSEATRDRQDETEKKGVKKSVDRKPDEKVQGEDESIPGPDDSRRVKFTYETTIEPGGAGPVDIFVPLAVDTAHQTVHEREVEAPVQGEVRTDSKYGNKFWYGHFDEMPEEPIEISVSYRVERRVFDRNELEERVETSIPKSVDGEFDKFLTSNRRVPVSDEIVVETAKGAGLDEISHPLKAARRIYDFVIDEMEYKKVGDGWGNGDTYWACNEKYGNCTDYHALVTSLARWKKIPARFEIGVPVPTGRASGKVKGYHCWLKLYLPGVGWTPIDASEADKHPELREMYFGAQPANRIFFAKGRDLQLGEEHDTKPINFFIYPHVEVGDETYDAVETSFRFEELET